MRYGGSMLNRMLFRELTQGGERSNRTVLLAIVLISAIGVTAFVCMLTAYRNLERSRLRYYAQCRMGDFWVDLKKAPVSDIEALHDVAGVVDLRSRIQLPALVDLPGVEKPLAGIVLTMPDERRPVINDLVIRRGAYFSSGRASEVIVSEDFAEQRGLTVGDHVRLNVNRRQVDLAIIGTAISSEFVYLLPPGAIVPEPDSYGVFWLPRSFAEETFDLDGACNQVVGLVAPALRNDPTLVLEALERRLKPCGVLATTPRRLQTSHLSLQSEMEGLELMAFFLPVLFLGVAAIVLNTLITSLAEQQRTVVGTLKAMGYTRGAVFGHYLKFATVVAGVGAAVGCCLGYLLAGGLTNIYRSQFFKFPDLVNNVYPDLMLAAFCGSVFFAILGALRGARRMLRLSPADAMRPAPPKAGHRLVVERWTAVWTRLGFAWQAVLRSLFRDWGRTLAGLIAASLGCALMVNAFYQSNAFRYLLDFQFERLLVSEYSLIFRDVEDSSAVAEVRRIPGVQYAEPVFSVACRLHHGNAERRAGVEGVARNAILTVPRDADGEPVALPSSGLLLTEKMAEILHAGPGDTLVLEEIRGRQQEHVVTVAGVVTSYAGLGVYADYAWLNELVGETEAVSRVELLTDHREDSRRHLQAAVKSTPGIEALQAVREKKQSMEEEMLGPMLVVTTVTLVFAGLIFFGSILNASLVALSERRREVATYRVLGYSSRAVGGIFLRESLVVNLAGAFLGLPLGWWLAMAYAHAFNFETFRMPAVVPLHAFVYPCALAVGFTLIAHLVVQNRVRRLDWLAALNIKE